MHLFSRTISLFLDCLFPVLCYGCGREGSLLCGECRSMLKTAAPSCFVCGKIIPAFGGDLPGRTCFPCRRHTAIYAFSAPFLYNDPLIRTLIHEFKYKRIKPLGAVFADLLSASGHYYGIAFPRDALLVPIPLHKTRARLRGFNQTVLVGKRMAEIASIPCETGILEKVKKTKPQVGLLGEERRNNMQGSFAVKNPALIRGRTVILLDDVKTTGTTLEEAARALKKAGARRVWAVAIAR